jgi:hypothetical protein
MSELRSFYSSPPTYEEIVPNGESGGLVCTKIICFDQFLIPKPWMKAIYQDYRPDEQEKYERGSQNSS